MRKYYGRSDSGFREVETPEEAYWVDISAPKKRDVEYLTEKEGVPRMFLEYLEDGDERPRLERDGDWKMVIVRIPVRNNDDTMPYRTMPLGIISRSEKRVITVCYHTDTILRDFSEHTRVKNIRVVDEADFTLRIFYSTAYWYLTYLRTLTDDVVGAEKALEKSVQNDDLMWLMRMQKSLVFFNTSIKGNMMVLERIQKLYGERLDVDLIEDVDIEFKQADSTVGIYSDILESTMDAYASIISNNMNGVMKRMTGLSIILMVPTFVASLYGMNVDILMGNNKFAFWIILLIAAVLTVGAFLALRKLKWV